MLINIGGEGCGRMERVVEGEKEVRANSRSKPKSEDKGQDEGDERYGGEGG